MTARPSLELDTTWMEDARCAGINPDLFFPARGEPSEPAKAVCRQCPACTACREYALTQHELFGVWGGTSERDRRAIRRRRRLAASRTTVRAGSMFTMKADT
jgi:WhiB family redox-sensing transcriptional regulator